MFAPARYPGLVGVELELIPVTDTPLPRPVAPEWLAAGFDAGFVRAAAPSFEPGGQLELSLPPRPTVEDLAADVAVLSRRAAAIAAARGIRLEAVGLNPYHSCADVPLRRPEPRYLAMQRAFDEVGADGRRMMRLTASLQIAVGLLPGRAGHEQWLVANLAGPPLAAAFANSAVAAGRAAGIPGARTRIWQNADLRRTGYDGRHLDRTDPVGAYAAFAAAAPRLPIREAEQPAYHLSTLFPPVRPRGGYLEVRYLDAQPLWRIPEAVGVVASLLYDDRARHDALDLLLPRAQDQHRAWGAALTALAAGSLTGTLARAARGMPGPQALPLAAAIMACGLAATAVAPGLPAALAGLATVGIGWSCFLGTTIAMLQSADPRMLGRVMSLFAVVLLGGASAGAPVASFLAASLGPRTPFFAGTAAAIAALAVAVGATRTGTQPSREEPAAVMVADKYSPHLSGSGRSDVAGPGVVIDLIKGVVPRKSGFEEAAVPQRLHGGGLHRGGLAAGVNGHGLP